MSDRIMVLHAGEAQKIFPRAEATQEKLLAAAIKESHAPPVATAPAGAF